ncbi:MAG: hypothetical protein K5871_04380 [Lachnospiraceae bacterium]|nr:hypothetical protein [Lachnospiraceae bacterium]
MIKGKPFAQLYHKDNILGIYIHSHLYCLKYDKIHILTGGGRAIYHLSSDEYDINMDLAGEYKDLEVYHEAIGIIKDHLISEEDEVSNET